MQHHHPSLFLHKFTFSSGTKLFFPRNWAKSAPTWRGKRPTNKLKYFSFLAQTNLWFKKIFKWGLGQLFKGEVYVQRHDLSAVPGLADFNSVLSWTALVKTLTKAGSCLGQCWLQSINHWIWQCGPGRSRGSHRPWTLQRYSPSAVPYRAEVVPVLS